jgi:hypothetical protein
MAFTHGKNTDIWLDGADVTAYFHEFGTTATVDTAESTTFGASWKTFLAGQAVMEVSGSGYFDPTFTDIWHDIQQAVDPVVTYGLGGLTQGAFCRLVPVVETSYEEAASIGGLTSFDWSATSDKSPGLEGRVLTPLTAITGDGNGTNVNNGGATTTGAIAHLHVTSVSASDSIIVTIEDSANGSSGWATIGTFASKSAVGAERIVIAGTVRQYTRAVYDVTGAAVSITVGVALART